MVFLYRPTTTTLTRINNSKLCSSNNNSSRARGNSLARLREGRGAPLQPRKGKTLMHLRRRIRPLPHRLESGKLKGESQSPGAQGTLRTQGYLEGKRLVTDISLYELEAIQFRQF